MNPNSALHQSAMEMNTFADVSMAKGFPEQAAEFYKIAYEMEKKAALMALASGNGPLPHYVLLRSAAALAYHAGLYKESERMIEFCLSLNPPDWLKAELVEINSLIEKEQKTGKKTEKTRIEGVLANVIFDENLITIKDPAHDQNFSVIVPMKLFPRIVKKHWSKKVTVEARQTPHGVMVLEKISAAA